MAVEPGLIQKAVRDLGVDDSLPMTAVVSEPSGGRGDLWPMIPQATPVTVRDGRVDIQPFRPAA